MDVLPRRRRRGTRRGTRRRPCGRAASNGACGCTGHHLRPCRKRATQPQERPPAQRAWWMHFLVITVTTSGRDLEIGGAKCPAQRRTGPQLLALGRLCRGLRSGRRPHMCLAATAAQSDASECHSGASVACGTPRSCGVVFKGDARRRNCERGLMTLTLATQEGAPAYATCDPVATCAA